MDLDIFSLTQDKITQIQPITKPTSLSLRMMR